MLLIFVGDVTVISWNSRTPEKGSSLKWQLSHTHSRALREFFMIRIAFRMEHCKCTKLFQWIHINFLEFIRTVLLHRLQVDDRKRSDFGLVCWLSRLAGPGFVSMSPDSISLCVEELLLCVCVCVYVHPSWRLHPSGVGSPGYRSTMLCWRRYFPLPSSFNNTSVWITKPF